jgi:hypothetical protein
MFESMTQSPVGGYPEEGFAMTGGPGRAIPGKSVKSELVRIVSKTYDLGKPGDNEAYESDRRMLMECVPKRTCSVLAMEPLRFTESDDRPRYIAYLQWAEFKLTEIQIETTPVGAPSSSKPEQES